MGRQRWDPGSLWAIEGLQWIDHQHQCVFGNRWKQKEVSAGQNLSDLARDLRNQGNLGRFFIATYTWKALKFHQFYFGDEFQNLELEEIKEEDAEGKEVNVGVAEKKKGAHTVLFKQSVAAGIGSLKPQNKTDEISNTAFKA
ncbi:hypothetical protein YC2023_099505 [Brassica napus]